jgi:hypothetical protein
VAAVVRHATRLLHTMRAELEAATADLDLMPLVLAALDAEADADERRQQRERAHSLRAGPISLAPTCASYERVLAECSRWGVRVVRAAPMDPNALSRQPSTDTWLAWPERIIYQPDPHPLALLHDLGHAVIGIDPRFAHEIDHGVMAFECCQHAALGLKREALGDAWVTWMQTYGIWEPTRDEVVTYFEASAAAIEADMQLSLAGAVRLGVLHPDGSPTYQLAPLQRQA